MSSEPGPIGPTTRMRMPAPVPARQRPPVPTSVAHGWLRATVRSPQAWLVAVAFLLRLLWVLLVRTRPVGDFALYREAAEYLADQGRLDPEFVYMPGYVMMLAGLRWLCAGWSEGGILMAAKMIGVVAGTTVAAAAGGIARDLFGRRAGLIATALGAVWPAGIAVASVTGTDVPAAALVSLAILALVRLAPRRPWLAALSCGLLLGLAAWVRAVAAPLGALTLIYWLACGVRWRVAVARSGVALAAAFLMLLPWAIRNWQIYGEVLFTDSHGGNTALVGANPNSEGTYSRSLNLMFADGTGYRALETTVRHRQSDRAAQELARHWTAFEPIYALGLVIAKADRLLGAERNLLYWPVFREGVLDERHRAFFRAHRAALERVTDLAWWALAALTAAGLALCAVGFSNPARTGAIDSTGIPGGRPRRPWPALALAVFPLALTGIYAVLFAEVRYHLAIVPFLLPYAACAVDWLWSAAQRRFRGDRRAVSAVLGSVAALFVCWTAMLELGNTLRARHRWAVAVCAYPSAAQVHLCAWSRGPVPTGGDSPIRGSWDGVGLRVNRPATEGVVASARTVIPVGWGRFRVSAVVHFSRGGAPETGGGTPENGLAVALRADGRVIARVVSPGSTSSLVSPDLSISGIIEHAGGPLLLEAQVEPAGIRSTVDGGTIWVSQLIVERF